MKPQQPKESDLIPPLQRLEAINRAILDSALDCIITMDAAGLVREFNPAAERVFGFSRAEVLGRELAQLIIPPALREKHRQGLARYLQTGEGPVLGKRIEINAMRRDGSEILVELAITPFQIDGSPFFTAYLRDITERKRGEDASRRLSAIVESSEDAIISKNLDGVILTWNKGAERVFGYTPDEIIGQPVALLIPLDRHDEEPAILERIRRGEAVDQYETVRQRKDGTLLNISLTVSPIKDESGRVIGASKIVRDITERVRTERRRIAQYNVASLLAGSHTLSEAAAEIIRTIATIGNWVAGSIWLCNDDCTTLHCEVTWHVGASSLETFGQVTRVTLLTNTTGLPGRVVSSRKPTWIADVTCDDNFPRRAAAIDAGLRGAFAFPLRAYGEVNGVLELFSPEIAQPDEDLFQLVEALGGQIGLFIHREQVEEELQHEKESAEAANAAKDRFLAMLSHELRTPLTPVLIWAGGMVSEPELSPEIREGLKMVCRNVELEARLIDDLLDLTRITRGKLKLQLGPADVHELIKHALEIVRNEMEDRQLHVSVALDAPDPVLIVDAPRLQQVFWNIFRNAYKFAPHNGAVSVRSHNPVPNTISVEITDNGIGIEPPFLEKIFDAFEQLDAGREGLGLGLAISKAIVEMHGGTIRAYSEGRGKGATFIIDLPLDRAELSA
ncbi:MAG: PAS domain S-box protein [Verrucomicrobiota bacterium]|nr:PAS domain S-box protein [Verrucomicrobiota bacterium]